MSSQLRIISSHPLDQQLRYLSEDDILTESSLFIILDVALKLRATSLFLERFMNLLVATERMGTDYRAVIEKSPSVIRFQSSESHHVSSTGDRNVWTVGQIVRRQCEGSAARA
jgi:hypothetical protein